MRFNLNKLKYMLGLTKDGRVTPSYLPSNFTIKGNVKVPAGFVVTTSAGNLIGPGKSFSAGNATLKDGTPVTNFETFSAWINEGKDTAAGYGIQQISEGEDVSRYTDGFSDEEIAGMKLPETNIPPSFFTQIISNMKLFTNPDNLRKDLETLNFLYYHYSQEIINSKEIKDELKDTYLGNVYSGFATYMYDSFRAKFIQSKKAKDIYGERASVLTFIDKKSGRAILFDGGYYSLVNKENLTPYGQQQGQHQPTQASSPIPVSKKIKAEENIEKIKKTLAYITELDNSLPDEIKQTKEYAALIHGVKRAYDAIKELQTSSKEDDRYSRALATIGEFSESVDSFVIAIRNSGIEHPMAFVTTLKANEVIIDQMFVDTAEISAQAEVDSYPEGTPERLKAERRLKFIQSISHRHSVDTFIDNVSELTGLTREDVLEKLKGLEIRVKKSGNNYEKVKIFDESGNLIPASMSMAVRTALSIELGNKFGFSNTSDLDTIFSIDSFLRTPHLGPAACGWNPGQPDGRLSGNQVSVLKTDAKAVDYERARNHLAKILSQEKYEIPRGGGSYTIEEALSIENDEDRFITSYGILKQIEAKKASAEPDSYEYHKLDYLETKLRSIIKIDKRYVEKIPPDGSVLSAEKLEENRMGRDVCSNLTAGLYIGLAAFKLDDSSHRILNSQLNMLPFFMNAKNPHLLVSAFGVPFGVRVGKNKELEMNYEIREQLEDFYREDGNELPENMSESEKIVTLIEFYRDSNHTLTLPADVFAKARLEALSNGSIDVEIIDDEFSGNRILSDSIDVTDEFGNKLIDEYIDVVKGKNTSITPEEIAARHFGLSPGDPQYNIVVKFIKEDIESRKNAGLRGNTGYYTENYVNLTTALRLGKVTGHSSEGGISTIEVEGSDGRVYHVANWERSTSGFGDSLIITLDEENNVSGFTFFEQKYGKTEAPHVNNVINALRILEALAARKNKDGSKKYRLPTRESGNTYFPMTRLLYSQGNEGEDRLKFFFSLRASLSAREMPDRNGINALGEKEG